ncbi:methylmalonyl-CoA mutase family protein [Planomonospora parontospora]|uniref:methylmalonyl-CoA mutase family protein n=1 Tax=Planomonospora parontospora TaxID=58119 RepID=UPI00167017E6|nr:methylmalonyl-CoA mutase family protein [Planomonospora parontospora]GGL25575.1 methylmalonyl-CoA mutase [Planomonospora parontospora subsp. antibiotica]GII16320.1 methylmalonyl-CoA mutase [Planomonospora parontospora subsp. antibiotica]
MTVPPEELRPAADLPPPTRDEWRELALGVLRKSGVQASSPEEALASTTYDGVTVAPLYDAADLPGDPGLPGAAPYLRGARPVRGGWDVRQRHEAADPEAVLADLENGVTSLWLALAPEDLPRVLERVHLELISVVLEAGERTGEAAEALLAIAARRAEPAGSGAAGLTGNLGADPLGLRARTGSTAHTGTGTATGARTDAVTDTAMEEAVALARRCAADLPGLRALVVDATPYHDAGGGDAEELGCSLATGVAYLRALTGGGLGLEQAFGQLEFRYAATADQFLTVAKFRAARRLWARVAEACGAGPEPDPADPGRALAAQLQHAVTSSAMMTARDPWVNMLRTTLACFAAGIGGADAVTVQPFDARLGLPDAFSRRIARNTHALLVEEAHVARVTDPAGGSFYAERLTADLAERAWAWFQEIERAGGMARALESGLVAGRLAATRERRAANIARRRDPITGVSEFPNLDERLPERTPRPAAPGTPRPAAPGTAGAAAPGTAAPAGAAGAEGLPVVHHAREFEALRDLADAQETRPAVFLATIGPVAAHTARASFAANLFQAGGLATVACGPLTDPGEIAAAFTASGARVACLCSGDKLYGEHAEAVAAALAGAGAKRIWLAGRGDHPNVDGNVYAGCDALAVLRETFGDLGVGRTAPDGPAGPGGPGTDPAAGGGPVTALDEKGEAR